MAHPLHTYIQVADKSIYLVVYSHSYCVNRFIDHLYTQLVGTSNYNAIANLDSLEITTEPAKPAVSSPAVPWQRNLTLKILLPPAQIVPSQPPVQSYLSNDFVPCL
jgi:hypothetical protein